MSAQFFDQNNDSNPYNGTVLIDGAAAKALLKSNVSNKPFFAELISDHQTKLLIGLGPKIACAQFSTSNDDPPYLMASLESERMQSGFAEFLIEGTPSEVPRRLCVPLSVLLDVAAHFVETGERSPIVDWEVI